MSDKNQEGSCCGSTPQEGKKQDGCCCCGVKKFIIGILIIGLSFLAGFLFAKGCPVGQRMCPMVEGGAAR